MSAPLPSGVKRIHIGCGNPCNCLKAHQQVEITTRNGDSHVVTFEFICLSPFITGSTLLLQSRTVAHGAGRGHCLPVPLSTSPGRLAHSRTGPRIAFTRSNRGSR